MPVGTGLPRLCRAAEGDVVRVLADVAPWTPLYAVLPQLIGGLTVSGGCPGGPQPPRVGPALRTGMEWGTGVPNLLPLPVCLQFRLRNHDTPLTLTRRGLVLAPASGFDSSKDTQVGSSVPRLSQPPRSPSGLRPSLALPTALPVLSFHRAPGSPQPQECSSPVPIPGSIPVCITSPVPKPVPVPVSNLSSSPSPPLFLLQAPFSSLFPFPFLSLSLFPSPSCPYSCPWPITVLIPTPVPVSVPIPVPGATRAIPQLPPRFPADVQAGDRGDGPSRA